MTTDIPAVDIPATALSLLDLASVHDGATATEALADTLTVAREADRLGYRRFWVAEHHGMPAIARSSPPVLIAAIAAATHRIRVGSGGVMLPNHSALIVAEQFGTLVALHGDRIDLGLGRAPGTDRTVMEAIRRDAGPETVDQFPHQVLELLAYLGISEPLVSGEGSRIVAVPGNDVHPQPWLLGSSDFSARLAGALGLPFAFAHHFAGGEHTPLAFELYRRSFTPSTVLDRPRAMVAVAALVADDAAAARRLMLPQSLLQLRMRRGQPPTRIPSQQEAESYPWSEPENAFVDERLADQAVGDLEHVRARIAALVDSTGAEEVMVVLQGTSVEQRLRTVRDLTLISAG